LPTQILDGEVLNCAAGFSITFPKSWEGKWISAYTQNGVMVFDRAIQEAQGEAGLLFTVSRYQGGPQQEYATPTYVLGTYNGYTYVFSPPSDVEWAGTDQTLSDEYKKMCQDFPSIRKNIKLGDFTNTGEIRLSSQWDDIYQRTLWDYMKQDPALNDNISFIAIDLSSLEYANDYDKKVISVWFENQFAPVKDANLDDLKSEGLFDASISSIPNGLLLTIDKVTQSDNEIIIDGTKYRGDDKHDHFETTWQMDNNTWNLVGTKMN